VMTSMGRRSAALNRARRGGALIRPSAGILRFNGAGLNRARRAPGAGSMRA